MNYNTQYTPGKCQNLRHNCGCYRPESHPDYYPCCSFEKSDDCEKRDNRSCCSKDNRSCCSNELLYFMFGYMFRKNCDDRY